VKDGEFYQDKAVEVSSGQALDVLEVQYW
jgi:hypothetical protein